MKNKDIVLGIIAEYNPFHYGHAYQLRTLRKMTKAQTVVVLMSGNVVQRGEFAIVDKWKRAEAALKSGADLVLEAPIVASLQGADYFAKYNVQLLSKLNVTTIGFGTESATTQELKEFVRWRNTHKVDIDYYIKIALQKGMSYAASYDFAIQQLNSSSSFDISSPNHLLAIQYTDMIEKYHHQLDMVTLPRINSLNEKAVLSGSEIREAIKEGVQSDTLVPLPMSQLLKESYLIDWDNVYPFLRYRLAQHQPESLRRIWGIREGIEHLILKNFLLTPKYTQFLESMVSKRWTKSSIQRILMSILLDFSIDEWKEWEKQLQQQPTVQVLGFTDTGRKHLKTLKSQSEVRIISNINQKTASLFPENLRADAIMQMISLDEVHEQNYKKRPIIIK